MDIRERCEYKVSTPERREGEDTLKKLNIPGKESKSIAEVL